MRIVLDTEVYENYFLATFITEAGIIREFERLDDRWIMGDLQGLVFFAKQLILDGHTLITFNGRRYDIPILSMAVNGSDNAQLKEASNKIIVDNAMWWHLEQHYYFSCLDIDHIDIINLLPLYESLKMYGARNGTEMIQDLPFDPDDLITPEKATELRNYCRKDCKVTWELFVTLWPEIQLRISMGELYNQDLRSKSDAQIAEAVMISEFQSITGNRLMKPIDAGGLPTSVQYTAPDWVIDFHSEAFGKFVNQLSGETFQLHPTNSKPLSPDWLKKKTVEIGGKPYTVGLGGLHAKNKSESYFSGSRGQLIEIDVRSFYPAIILNNGYEPPHMGSTFTEIYGGVVEQRLKAKAAGDKITAEVLKITINGTYGKLGSKYSAVYAPQLLLGVTFTGQLALLMLIEMMALRGIQSVSANTDGIVVMGEGDLVPLYETVKEWEQITGFDMEYSFYKSIHYRDVNNYFAITTEGDIKKKGVFRVLARGKEHSLDKNPQAPIVFKAAIDHVLHGTPIERTIDRCIDVKQFLSARKVAGGGAKDGEYLGKAVRWYYSTDTATAIHYISNGNMVAKTTGAMPMMDLTEVLPADLDLDWYYREAQETVDLVGFFPWL